MFADVDSNWIMSMVLDLILNLVLYWVLFKFGVLCLTHHGRDGVFHIDRSNPEKDIYRLDITDLDGLVHKKYLMLKIDKDAHLSVQTRD